MHTGEIQYDLRKVCALVGIHTYKLPQYTAQVGLYYFIAHPAQDLNLGCEWAKPSEDGPPCLLEVHASQREHRIKCTEPGKNKTCLKSGRHCMASSLENEIIKFDRGPVVDREMRTNIYLHTSNHLISLQPLRLSSENKKLKISWVG